MKSTFVDQLLKLQPPSKSVVRHDPVRDDYVTFWNAQLDLKLLLQQLVQPSEQYEAVCISRIGNLFERRATWRLDSLSKRQLQDLLPNSTFDLQYARRTQPVVGAHPGNSPTSLTANPINRRERQSTNALAADVINPIGCC